MRTFMLTVHGDSSNQPTLRADVPTNIVRWVSLTYDMSQIRLILQTNHIQSWALLDILTRNLLIDIVGRRKTVMTFSARRCRVQDCDC
jgi:hypothetical protein